MGDVADDLRVIELREDAGFACEARDVVLSMLGQNLDGHRRRGLLIDGFVDFAHAASAGLVQHPKSMVYNVTRFHGVHGTPRAREQPTGFAGVDARLPVRESMSYEG